MSKYLLKEVRRLQEAYDAEFDKNLALERKVSELRERLLWAGLGGWTISPIEDHETDSGTTKA